ncbi:EIN3-binding F-box protein 1-like [Trifolium pratense]|uniref:EIN3-binding F-box protein 1-like n=1 Tax=Trifolium pratense TaxID=57577 RepID=UPI001E696002|nr:EIN3-binding F-box protein 1-like [Trifolium pratense]
MPGRVNNNGDELYPGGSRGGSRLHNNSSNADVYCPPKKRARISSPFIIGDLEHEEDYKSSIEILPDECLFEIFRRVECGKERSLCASVSKRWLMLVSSICKDEIESVVETNSSGVSGEDFEGDGFLTRRLEGKKATDVRLAAIAVGTGCRGGLGNLSIRGSNSERGVTDHGISAIARGCPSLRSLSLWNVPSVGDKGLCEIAKGCHMLEKLDLCHSQITNKALNAIAEGCPDLTTLNIESCSMIGNEGLQAIAKSCPKLQSISIRDCPLVGDHGVASLLSLASNLTRVKLQHLNITDFSLAVIGHYGKAITNLVLSRLPNVNERGFWVMGVAQGLQNLVSLTITSCLGVTDASMEAIGKGCPNLKQMYLRRCCFVSDSGLVAFAKAAGSLENLQLEECNRVTQYGIIGALSNFKTKLKSLTLVKCVGVTDIDVEVSMFSPCESLQSITIQNCPGLGSASLAMIGKLCPQLQHVDLTGLNHITDAGLLPLLENCEAGLVNVNLKGCSNLTDNIVSALARLHGGTLKVLNLDGCCYVTDASLVAIADDCLLLDDLDVSKSAITDAGIAVLSDAKQLNLRVLSLSGCPYVSNKSVPFLMKLGQTLLGLNIKNSNAIGYNAIRFLVGKLWRCDILV